MILEYKLDRTHDGLMTTPPWVERGGYYYDPDSFTIIGFSPSKRKYKIPDSVTKLTVEELKARVLDLHDRYPVFVNPPIDMTPFSQSQIESDVDELISTYDIP